MNTDRLTMDEVSRQIALDETERQLANQRWAIEERIRELLKEYTHLVRHQSLLSAPVSRYIANSLRDPDILKMVHREFFPSVMPVSVLFHVDGPVYTALLSASGLKDAPPPQECPPEPHMRTIQEPFGLPESMAGAVLAVHLAQSIQNFHNKGRPLNARISPLSEDQRASIAMSGFNSPGAWVERLYEFQDYLKNHISGNDHHEGAKDRYLATVMSAANRQMTTVRMLTQVKAKAERVDEQIREAERELCALWPKGEALPIPIELAPILDVDVSIEDTTHKMSALQLISVLSLQQKRKEILRQLKDATQAKEGALSYQQFIKSEGVSYVVNSLADPELVEKLLGEFSLIVYPDGVDYPMQSAAQGLLSGIAIELVMEGAKMRSPLLDPWEPSRMGGDGEAGLIHRVAAAAMAHQCGKWLMMLHEGSQSPLQDAPLFTKEHYTSLALSGFHNPPLWEELYALIHGMLEFGNRPPPSLLPSHIVEAANKGWVPSTLSQQADREVEDALRNEEVLRQELSRVDVEISKSPHRELVVMASNNASAGTPADLGLQSNRAGRAMIFRLLSMLKGKSADRVIKTD